MKVKIDIEVGADELHRIAADIRLHSSTPEVPQGAEAVRQVMRGGGIWTARELLAELERRGWEPRNAKRPLAATEAAIGRLFRTKKELDRVGRGEYAYKGWPGLPTSIQGVSVLREP